MIEAPTVRTAFVLAGGGSLAAAQVGMLAALTAAGERPDLIVGVSAGAINAAFFAADPSVRTIVKMEQLWRTITTRRVLGLSWRSLLGLLGLRDHVGSSGGLRGLLREQMEYQEFAAAAVPLHILCADLLTGQEVVLSHGNVLEAVVASAAIPGVFPAVSIGDRWLIDGAVASNTPIATAISLGANRLIVLPAGFACATKVIPRRAYSRAMHAITLVSARQLLQDFERYSDRVPIHIVPPLCPVTHSSYDYAHGSELIQRGRDSARHWLETDGLSHRVFPGPLHMHTH